MADKAWMHELAKGVGRAVAEHGAEVEYFVRYALAEQ